MIQAAARDFVHRTQVAFYFIGPNGPIQSAHVNARSIVFRGVGGAFGLMDRDDKGYFTATAMALAATQMIERILEDWKRRQPDAFASFAAKSIEDLERVLEQTRAAAEDAPFSRQALFRNAASVQLDLVRPLARKASRAEGRLSSDRRREPDDVA